ncbi:putative thaumatin/PR5-like protein [Feldmannia species virus]|uniref:Putative thaumatin/PR5-like protein n=1 Tax=Feldmannia species virus TaxID=39420 RepID=B5LW99_9PHYC|nr:putative thaumatin/PR5-like protein [Feldmannia species virus]ACH46762.1 putative thaumatin/PR5-like protein [Feldmannia species virus]
MNLKYIITTLLGLKCAGIFSNECQCSVKTKKDSRHLTILNSCTFDLALGVTGGNEGPAKESATCPLNQMFHEETDNCFWHLEGSPKVLLSGASWETDIHEVKNHLFSGNVWGVKEDQFDSHCRGGECMPWRGPGGSVTKVEFTFIPNGIDYYDISVIEGVNLPVTMSPDSGDKDLENKYICGVAGGDCSWDFKPDHDLEKYLTLVTANGDGSTCETTVDCPRAGDVCGTYDKEHGVCGELNGFSSAHSNCIAGATGYPFHCELYGDAISCSGRYHLSGYNAHVYTSSDHRVCGCPDWEEMGVNAPPVSPCRSSDETWEERSLPFLIFLKRGCPSAYEFAYSDMTSTFSCPTSSGYTIEFCPGDSEERFFKFA